MAICRWSSDDFTSDFYVFEAVGGGFQVMVASSRTNHNPDTLGPWPETPGPGVSEESEEWLTWVNAYIERKNALIKMMNNAPRTPVPPPLGGQSFTFDSAVEVVEFFEKEVIPLGKYHIPEWAIDELKEWELETDVE